MVVYGKQIFFYLLQKHPELIKKVLVTKPLDQRVYNDLRKRGKIVATIDNKKAQALAHGGNHQGVLVEIEEYRFTPFKDVKEQNFFVILSQITDVGNIGSIIRSAYALGVDSVIVTGLRQLKMDGVIRRSSGAALDMPIVMETNIFDVIKELQDQDVKVYGADMSGEDVRKKSFKHKKAIVLGSEGEGLSKKVLHKVDEVVKIVMAREFDSLNVAAAAAIFIDRMRDE